MLGVLCSVRFVQGLVGCSMWTFVFGWLTVCTYCQHGWFSIVWSLYLYSVVFISHLFCWVDCCEIAAVVPGQIFSIYLVDENSRKFWPVGHCCFYIAGCAMSGLIADAKTLIDKARVETQVNQHLLCFLLWCMCTLFNDDRATWVILQVSVLLLDMALGSVVGWFPCYNPGDLGFSFPGIAA